MSPAPEIEGPNPARAKQTERVLQLEPEGVDLIVRDRNTGVEELATAVQPMVLPLNGQPAEREEPDDQALVEGFALFRRAEALPVDERLGAQPGALLDPLGAVLDRPGELEGGDGERFEQSVATLRSQGAQCAE
jgi:hypothetical protein